MTSPTDPPPFNYRPQPELRDPHEPLDPTTWCTVHWEPSSECVTRVHDMRVAAEVEVLEVLPSPTTAPRWAMTLAVAEKLRRWWPGAGRELLREMLGREPRDGDEFTLFGVPMRWRAPLVPLHRFAPPPLEPNPADGWRLAGDGCPAETTRVGFAGSRLGPLRCVRRAGHEGPHEDGHGALWTFSGGCARRVDGVALGDPVSMCEATLADGPQGTHHCGRLEDHDGGHVCRDASCTHRWTDDVVDPVPAEELPPLRAEGNAILDRDGEVVGLFASREWARMVERYATAYAKQVRAGGDRS